MTTVAPNSLLETPERDRWPAELRLLLGEDAGGILAVAASTAGAELRSWKVRQVTHEPGRSTVVQYRAEFEWPDGSATAETVVGATGARIPDGAAVLDDGETKVAVWRWPADPSLPGLSRALDRDQVAGLLDEVGVDGGVVQLRVRAYRPGRRAVVEATGRRGRLFLKVVRPTTVEALHHTHRSLAAALPVPDSVGWTGDGIVVLPGLPGSTLRELLRSGRSQLPPPESIDALLDRLPTELAAGPRRRDLLTSAEHHASVIASVLPSLQGRLDDLLADLSGRGFVEHDLVPVHGDLYEAQLLVDRGRLTGLLDLDTAGAGHRVEDIANLCAHLSVLALTSDRPKVIRRYGAALLGYAESRFDRADLRARIAAALIGLATGPFRVLDVRWPKATAHRVELAGEWLAGADRR
jgi:Phosphotransferase enzyme family